ncbi:hypothetical protein NAS141_07605 [Sulfitobacter sp. NAS-14.1]|nr:hypothetical protein NAS141_07605 [Sulfitobacter sp. NAS-14.1]
MINHTNLNKDLIWRNFALHFVKEFV